MFGWTNNMQMSANYLKDAQIMDFGVASNPGQINTKKLQQKKCLIFRKSLSVFTQLKNAAVVKYSWFFSMLTCFRKGRSENRVLISQLCDG